MSDSTRENWVKGVIWFFKVDQEFAEGFVDKIILPALAEAYDEGYIQAIVQRSGLTDPTRNPYLDA